MRFLCFFFATLCISPNLLASNPQIEWVIGDDIEDFSILPAGRMGLVTTYTTRGTTIRNKTWHFDFYDTSFQKHWDQEIVLDNSFIHLKSKVGDNQMLHLFFTTKNHAKYHYVTLDLTKAHLEHFSGIVPSKTETSFFELVGGHAIFGGETLSHLDYKNKESRPIPIDVKKRASISSLSINKADATFNGVIRVKTGRNTSELHLVNYNQEGNELGRTKIGGGQRGNELLNGSICSKGEQQFVVGTYSSDPGQPYSDGVYFASIGKGKQQKTQYFNLIDFKKFVGEKDNIMHHWSSKKRFNGGPEDIALDILPTQAIMRGDEIIFVGEAYYPIIDPYYDIASRTILSDRDGHLFTYGIVVCFDLKGNFKWQEHYTIGVRSHDFTSKTKVLQNDSSETVVLAFLYNNSVITETIKEDKLDPERKDIPILPEDQYVKYSSSSRQATLEKWYDNYFLSSRMATTRVLESKTKTSKETSVCLTRIKVQ